MNVSTKQQRIAELAASHPQRRFTSLNHHIDKQWLYEAYRRTRKNGASGVDNVTASEYERNLDDNLCNLLNRFKSGTYKAPPVKRVYVPKGSGGEKRPIGIPTLEDKILQRAVVMLMEPVYEHDFSDCSFGFRPGRSAHQALQSIWKACMDFKGAMVLDADIRKFFDDLDHAWLRKMLKLRINDGVILRTIGKWLKAGVMDNGSVSFPETGSPQGGVISPLLSNIYLHYVLDLWVKRVVSPRMTGRMKLVRFADDFVMIFSDSNDANRVMAVLPKRFAKFGLTLHPEKTRLVRFNRPDGSLEKSPETFNFLGFTHYWGKSRKGWPVVKRKTASDRLTRGLKEMWQWCKVYRHMKVAEQHRKLCQKVRGHLGYFGITNNGRCLHNYVNTVKRTWHYWLNRRNRERRLNWETFNQLLITYPLPEVRIVHSYTKS